MYVPYLAYSVFCGDSQTYYLAQVMPMSTLFSNLSIFVSDGLSPMLTMLSSWLMSDGLYLGLVVIAVPLLGRIINILKKLF